MEEGEERLEEADTMDILVSWIPGENVDSTNVGSWGLMETELLTRELA